MVSLPKFYHALLPNVNEIHHSVSKGCYQFKGGHEHIDFEKYVQKLLQMRIQLMAEHYLTIGPSETRNTIK